MTRRGNEDEKTTKTRSEGALRGTLRLGRCKNWRRAETEVIDRESWIAPARGVPALNGKRAARDQLTNE